MRKPKTTPKESVTAASRGHLEPFETILHRMAQSSELPQALEALKASIQAVRDLPSVAEIRAERPAVQSEVENAAKQLARAEFEGPQEQEAASARLAAAKDKLVAQEGRTQALVEVRNEKIDAMLEARRAVIDTLVDDRREVDTLATEAAQAAADLLSIANAARRTVDIFGDANDLTLPHSEEWRSLAVPTAVHDVLDEVRAAWRIVDRDARGRR